MSWPPPAELSDLPSSPERPRRRVVSAGPVTQSAHHPARERAHHELSAEDEARSRRDARYVVDTAEKYFNDGHEATGAGGVAYDAARRGAEEGYVAYQEGARGRDLGRKIGEGSGAVVGGAIGTVVGGPVGSAVGAYLGAYAGGSFGSDVGAIGEGDWRGAARILSGTTAVNATGDLVGDIVGVFDSDAGGQVKRSVRRATRAVEDFFNSIF